ncbi:cytochrome-c peroxidase [Biomphalaria pfeifferi]|uniref:Cytochrome-c peroxidase n=1 Tax=Biomphalaria pfeifferi TaxID=112525 RepID=A0AAD8AMX1_BIOPF|nr:cytochrome-c peroxidase [Biomphalaria pfeifferi]
MHDGSFKTLEDVIQFYNRGGNQNPYLDSGIKPLNLSEAEKKDLVAFLRSLNGSNRFDAYGRPQPSEREKTVSSNQVAAIQFSPIPGKVRANTLKISKLIRIAAAESGSKYIVLPEYALTGKLTAQNITAKEAKSLAELSWQDAKNRLSNLSRELKVWLIVPVLETDKESNQVFSTHIVWNEKGKIVHRQRKVSPLTESGDQYISSGHFKNIQSFHTKDGLIGVVSGNDLVQGARRLAELGAKTILVSAAWSENEVFDYESECRELAEEFKVNIVISNLKEKNSDSALYGKVWDYSGKISAEDKESGNTIIYSSLNTSNSSNDYILEAPLGLPQIPQPTNRRNY